RLSREGRMSLTRTGDYNLPLAERAAMGRRAAADAFVSIHAGIGSDQVLVHPDAPPRAWQLARSVAPELSRLGGRRAPHVAAPPIAVLDPDHVGPKTAACLIQVGYGGTRYGDASWRDESHLDAI